ncbi:MAG TPA: hypothetical protein VH116_09305 [Gemmatimonadales bacterium]|jgi:hypothetical protein|nr:hypothetical protein [Gemmatimonadales bacterium]
MLNRSKTWAVVLLVATFITGLVVGASVRSIWARGAEQSSRSRGPERMLASLTAELRLTPSQHDSVGAILQRHWAEGNTVWDAVRPQFDSIRVRMDSDVIRQLTAEQAAKYRDHVTRYRHHQDEARPRKP